MYFPEHINLQKADDGYSSLHIAVANKHCDVAELLVQQVNMSCKLTEFYFVCCRISFHVEMIVCVS